MHTSWVIRLLHTKTSAYATDSHVQPQSDVLEQMQSAVQMSLQGGVQGAMLRVYNSQRCTLAVMVTDTNDYLRGHDVCMHGWPP